MRMHDTKITSQFPLFLNLNHVFSIFLAVLKKQYNNINIHVFDVYTIFDCRGIAKVLNVSLNRQPPGPPIATTC